MPTRKKTKKKQTISVKGKKNNTNQNNINIKIGTTKRVSKPRQQQQQQRQQQPTHMTVHIAQTPLQHINPPIFQNKQAEPALGVPIVESNPFNTPAPYHRDHNPFISKPEPEQEESTASTSYYEPPDVDSYTMAKLKNLAPLGSPQKKLSMNGFAFTPQKTRFNDYLDDFHSYSVNKDIDYVDDYDAPPLPSSFQSSNESVVSNLTMPDLENAEDFINEYNEEPQPMIPNNFQTSNEMVAKQLLPVKNEQLISNEEEDEANKPPTPIPVVMHNYKDLRETKLATDLYNKNQADDTVAKNYKKEELRQYFINTFPNDPDTKKFEKMTRPERVYFLRKRSGYYPAGNY